MESSMDPHAPEHAEPELDALLRSHRSVPDPRWVAATQDRLLNQSRGPTASRWRTWRPTPALRLGAAFAVVLAALILALSLAGSGPLGGESPVKAKDDCRTVPVTRTERVPIIVEGSDGEPRIVYERKPVQRFEKRCR